MSWMKKAYSRAKSRAQLLDRPFNLTEQDLQNLWDEQEGRCYWFRVHLTPLYDYREEHTRNHPLLPSLDRVDSADGYVVGNVVWTCLAANRAKGDCDPDEWEYFLELLATTL